MFICCVKIDWATVFYSSSEEMQPLSPKELALSSLQSNRSSFPGCLFCLECMESQALPSECSGTQRPNSATSEHLSPFLCCHKRKGCRFHSDSPKSSFLKQKGDLSSLQATLGSRNSNEFWILPLTCTATWNHQIHVTVILLWVCRELPDFEIIENFGWFVQNSPTSVFWGYLPRPLQ
jgi:hypothetical protein